MYHDDVSPNMKTSKPGQSFLESKMDAVGGDLGYPLYDSRCNQALPNRIEVNVKSIIAEFAGVPLGV